MSFPKEKSKRKGSDEDKPVLVKNAADLQRLKIEKLMKNPVGDQSSKFAVVQVGLY